ncbi:hypothetical protein DPMN_006850 [Dreissena polymorpha]|uniref:Uncharacterized protein n=1 Tax=Dreissena polymorpha TaxID=45954 RepID=A0A9D4MW60_DREPO|nr:hypothetical protein DPMN_006850 [Dreissena polymorpha]
MNIHHRPCYAVLLRDTLCFRRVYTVKVLVSTLSIRHPPCIRRVANVNDRSFTVFLLSSAVLSRDGSDIIKQYRRFPFNRREGSGDNRTSVPGQTRSHTDIQGISTAVAGPYTVVTGPNYAPTRTIPDAIIFPACH